MGGLVGLGARARRVSRGAGILGAARAQARDGVWAAVGPGRRGGAEVRGASRTLFGFV